MASTAAALVAVAAALGLRGRPARWRYTLLLAGLVRFALPTGWLQAAGGWLAPILPAPAFQVQAVEDLRRLLLLPGAGTAAALRTPAAGSGDGVAWLLPALWALGLAVCVWRWSRHWRLRMPALRPPDAAECDALERARRGLGMAGPVELRIAGGDKVPGALGYWRPVVALPDGLAAQLSPPELEAVLAHELAHVLRRDNLWAALAHALVSAFWFHPLVWWIEQRLLKERETACDELVLERGTPPAVYLSGILKVCRMAFGGAAGYAGVNGSNLELRMERIMSANVPGVSYWLRVSTGALVAVAALFPLAGGYLKAQPQASEAQRSESQDLCEQGATLLGAKQYEGAEMAFRRAYQLNPENSRGLLGLTEVYIAQGRQDEAVALLQREAAAHPDRQDLQLALGNTAVRAGQYEMAVEQYQKLLNRPGLGSSVAADLYLRLGETYRRMKQLPDALAALRKGAELGPANPAAIATLALVLDAAGQTAEAEQTYRKVLRIDANNGVARNNLAFLLAAHGGNLDEALDLAKDAQLFLPMLNETTDTLGYVYLTRKESDRAIAEFRDAVLKEPANATYRNHLVEALEQKGGRSSTAEALKLALRAEPTRENQEQVLKLLK